MKKLIVVTAWIAAIGLTINVQAADSASKAENVGFGSGLAIGALVGGPIGAIAGATIGVTFGDRYRDAKDSKAALKSKQKDLSEANYQLAQSQEEIHELKVVNGRLVEKQQRITQLRMEVLFHTDETEIDAAAQERLEKLADIVLSTDSIKVRLDGYADPRGDSEYNLKLSAERADTVKQALVEAGVPANRIDSVPQGEDVDISEDSDLDTLALSRRVTVKLINGDGQSVAQSL